MEQPPVLPDLSLLRRIGGGSYGDVWLARTITGVYRAVKVVDKARFADERPFLRELDGITRFQRSVGDQPRQLALMHVGRLEEQGIFYYVMELADDVEAGTGIDPENYQPLTLKALHERRPVLPAAEVIRIGSELARSLQGLHAAGLIHRDVKPSNIIFVAGVPKLADIGLVSSSDHTLTSLGTPGYSPPEGAGTLRADIYSLGKILYQLATGLKTDEFPRLPADVHQREDVRALLELNEVFLKACQPNPVDRYASAQEMLDDLMLLHAGRSVKELHRIRQRLRTLGRAALWLGAAALVVIAVLGVRNYVAVRALAAQEQRARIQAEADERLARYVGDLNLAQHALARHDLGLARMALRRHMPGAGEPDTRGLEWHALWNDAAGDDVASRGRLGGPPVPEFVVAPGGGTVITLEVGGSRTAVLWDIATGARRDLATGVQALGGFIDAGRAAVLGMADGSIRVVDTATGTVGEPLPIRGRIVIPTASAEASVIVVLTAPPEGVLFQVWDVADGRELARWQATDVPQARVTAMALDPAHRALAVGLVWSAEGGPHRELRLIELGDGRERFRQAYTGVWRTLAFSPDGGRIAAGGDDLPAAVLDASDGRERARFAGHESGVFGVVFSPDGSLVASAGDDQSVQLWRSADGGAVARFRGHEGGVTSVRWLEARRLASTGMDGTLRFWSLDAKRPPGARGGLWSEVLGDVLFDPDRPRLVATSRSGALEWIDAATLDAAGANGEVFHPISFRGGTLQALTPTHELADVDPATGEVRPRGLKPTSPGRLQLVCASRDGRRAALSFSRGDIEWWTLDAATSRTLPAKPDRPIWALAVSADGSRLASGDKLGVVTLWDAEEATPLLELGADAVGVTALIFVGESGPLLVGREDGRMDLVDLQEGRVIATHRVHNRPVFAFDVAPDGSRLVSGGDDGMLVVWSLPDLRVMALLQRQSASPMGARDVGIYRIRFAPDGSQLCAMSEDGSLFRWLLR